MYVQIASSGHLTGSAWLVDAAGERVLLTHHRKLNRWLQLGGHADGDHDLLRVALREAEEESGIDGIKPLSEQIFDLDVHLIPTRANEPEHFHYDVRFLLQCPEGQSPVVSDESHALQWMTIPELSAIDADESVRRMARKWSERRGNHSGNVL